MNERPTPIGKCLDVGLAASTTSGALSRDPQGFRMAMNAANIDDEVDPACISADACCRGVPRPVLGTLSDRR